MPSVVWHIFKGFGWGMSFLGLWFQLFKNLGYSSDEQFQNVLLYS